MSHIWLWYANLFAREAMHSRGGGGDDGFLFVKLNISCRKRRSLAGLVVVGIGDCRWLVDRMDEDAHDHFRTRCIERKVKVRVTVTVGFKVRVRARFRVRVRVRVRISVRVRILVWFGIGLGFRVRCGVRVRVRGSGWVKIVFLLQHCDCWDPRTEHLLSLWRWTDGTDFVF